MSEATLTIPGLIFIGAEGAGKTTAIVHMGPAVGWTIPRGIHTWSRELSVVMKADLTAEVQKAFGVVLPEQQGDPEFVPRARRAAQACTVVAVEGDIVDQLTAKGVRVHTVGFDRVSNGFFYFASGGSEPPRRVQGELIEIIAQSLEGGTREELDARLDGLIDRLLGELSAGALSEAQIELAEALPPLAPKGDKAAAKLQTLEGWLILAGTRSSKFEDDAKRLAETLRGATRREADVVEVPLFDEACRVVQPELDVEVTEGDAGKRSRLTLPARTRWFVTGEPASAARKPAAAAAPASSPQPSSRAAEDARAAAAKAAAEKAAADKAAAEKAAAEKAAAEKAAAEKAAAARAAERAAAEKAAAERAAAERAAAEKAAAERAAAARAAAEKAASERAAAERAAAEKAASERAATERAAAEHAAAERAAADKVASERIAAHKAAERAAAERALASQSKSALEGPQSSRAPVPKKKDSVSIVFLVLMLLLGAVIGAVLRLVRR